MIAAGVAKKLVIGLEATFGTAALAADGHYLRRVESSLDLTKDTYSSNEIRTDYQVADFRHGVRRIQGNIKGELSSETYGDFNTSLLRGNGNAVTDLNNTITIATTATPGVYKLTRAAGSNVTVGFKVGRVIQLQVAAGLNAANIKKNLLVTGVTATDLLVRTLNGSALVPQATIAGVTVKDVGSISLTPATGHVDASFSIEHHYSDLDVHELFVGCRVTGARFELPATGIATVDYSILGQDIQTGTGGYFVTPAQSPDSGLLTAVNGLLMVNGTPAGIITGLSMSVDGGYSADPVIGSNKVPFIAPGRVKVSGQFSAYFEDVTLRDSFINETALSLVAVLTADNTANSSFIAFNMPKIKVGGGSKTDGEKGIVATFPFTAILNTEGAIAGSVTENTTLAIQEYKTI